MKSLVLTDSFGGGGAERVASLLINGLSADNANEVHVCVFLDIPNYKIDVSHVYFHLLSAKQYPYALNVLNRIKNLVKTIKAIRPDVIYSFGPIMASYVILAVNMSGLRNSIRIVASERNDPRREPVSNLKKRLRDYSYSHSDTLVCQTPMAIDLLRARGVNTNYVLIPNPISPDLPQWQGAKSKDIITACRLTEQKNLTLLIDAFGRLHSEFPDYRLVIYGEGELRSMLENYVVSKGLASAIKLPGFATDIHQIMTHAYMYVSSSDYEGISNSMLEALGIGLPCVCTDCPVGGASMYINDGVSGLLTKVGDESGLYQAMRRLIMDGNLSSSISLQSRKIKDALSVQKITKMWVDLLES